jgi:hypothetical protein
METNMRTLNKVSLLIFILALAACGRTEHAPEASTASAAPIPATAGNAVPEPAARPAGIWFEPADLSACGSGKDVVKVHWDVTSMPNVGLVEVAPIEKGVAVGIFATGSAKGSKDTGPWMHAGGTMALINAANGEELARASVGSIPCSN